MTRDRPPRRISTVRVRPTEGRAPTTTSRMAASMSPAGAPDARTGAGQVPDERPQLLAVAARDAGQLAGAEVVAPAVARVQLERRGEPREQALVDGIAFDEEDVQALVALLGEQQAPRRGAVTPGAAGLLVE